MKIDQPNPNRVASNHWIKRWERKETNRVDAPTWRNSSSWSPSPAIPKWSSIIWMSNPWYRTKKKQKNNRSDQEHRPENLREADGKSCQSNDWRRGFGGSRQNSESIYMITTERSINRRRFHLLALHGYPKSYLLCCRKTILLYVPWRETSESCR